MGRKNSQWPTFKEDMQESQQNLQKARSIFHTYLLDSVYDPGQKLPLI